MAEKLTPEQKMAVENRGGRLLVSAAAGSGKTKVLVDRLLSYLQDPAEPGNIDEFLIITYTKAAAGELRGKIAAKLSEKIAQDPGDLHLQRQLQRLYLTKISTVHSFCADILREYAYRLDLSSDFRVGDENECAQLRLKALDQVLEAAYDGAGEDPDFTAFVDTQGLGRSDALVPQIIEKVYDSARCHLDPEAWLSECVKAAEAEGTMDAGETVWGRYLMDDLFSYLDLAIASMENCVRKVEAANGMQKAAQTLSDTVFQLQKLRQSTTWDQVVSRKDIDYGRLVFPKKAEDPSVTEPVKAVRKACKEGLDKKLKSFSDPSELVLEDLAASAAAARGLVGMVRKFSSEYDRLKRIHHILDFSDLEHRMLDLLLGKSRASLTAAAREIASRFREIMVDEYQDSNAVQDAIFNALSSRRQNLFMVGDVKQSIYQFRLADPGIFLAKYGAYLDPEAAGPGQGRKVLLSRNFRSGGGVIDGVNDVFYDCMSRNVGGLDYTGAEALKEGIPHIALPEPEVELHGIQVREDTYREEAAFVAERIAQLTDGTHYVRDGESLRPIQANDVVILLRSPGSVGQHYADALQSRGIRCSTGSGSDLLQTRQIAALRSLLQIISNPRQDIPLIAALASPIFGFTAEDLARLRTSDRKGCIYDALCAWEDPKAAAFLKLLRTLRSQMRLCTLPELLELIFELTDMEAVFAAMPGGKERRDDLESFYTLATQFEAGGPKDLEQFLEHLDAMEKKGLLVAAEASAAGAVTVMSIHKSKGLEFPVVFLCGLSRRFNRESLNEQVLCQQELGLGLCCVDPLTRVRYSAVSKRAIAAKMTSDSLSEEMRVLYVALTRARDRLIMTYASDSLEADLQNIVSRMDLCPREMLTSQVSCPGQWVLMSALGRTEAGAFFTLAGRPSKTSLHRSEWKISVAQVSEQTGVRIADEESAPELPRELLESVREGLDFTYPYRAAIAMPSKQTATQRKGRQKDQEAAEHAVEERLLPRAWRAPSFLEAGKSAVDCGNALHRAMQYIRFASCADAQGVCSELQRLEREGFLTKEQASMVDARAVAAFFSGPLGSRVRSAENVLREFKFSVLEDAACCGPELPGEYVLLQGVVDCAIVEQDRIILIDFKTDRVTKDSVRSVAAGYAPQLQAYADALQRIYGLPVTEKYLYFFRLGKSVEV